MNLHKQAANSYIADALTILLVWGTTAYGYINTGFSAVIIGFVLFLIYQGLKGRFSIRGAWSDLVIDRNLVQAFVVLYGALIFVSLFHLDNLQNLVGGYFNAVGFFLYTLPMWMVLYVGRNYDIRKAMVLIFYGLLYALCIFGIVRYFYMGQSMLDSFYFMKHTRVGMMLDMFLPFTVAFGVYFKRINWMKWATILLVVLEGVTLILTKTRGSYLAVSVSLLLFAFIYLYRYRERYSTLVKAVAVGLCVLVIAVAFAYGKYTRTGDSFGMKGGERFLMWQSSYEMFIDHPVTGIGLNEWEDAYKQGKYHPAESREPGQAMPHNVFVYFFSTAGVIGGMAYIIYLALVTKWCWKNLKCKSPSPFAWSMLFAFLAGTLHGLVDQTFIFRMTGRIYYLLMGITILFETVYREPAEKEEK